MSEYRKIVIDDLWEDTAMNICGVNDRNLAVLSELIKKDVSYRDQAFFIKDASDEDEVKINRILGLLFESARSGKTINDQDVIYACRIVDKNVNIDLKEIQSLLVGRNMSGRPIYPKTLGQYLFVKAMMENDIVFATGPAGTGKTFLAVIAAVSALKRGDIKKIVLTRPAVEAGESLGFLPGDLKEKVDPYLTPLYDALHEMLGNETTEKLMEKGTIEVAPLAYMRGRTLDDSYVILDEAQNTTASQMKMFLTRLGYRSKMVISGDISQIDLSGKQESGLINAVRILKGIKEISIIELTGDDVVRHPLVQKIIERYEKAEQK